jgi:PEGA domain
MKVFTLVMFCGGMFGSLYAQEKPRVFVTDSNSWQVISSVGGSGGTFGGSSAGGARPQTAEVIKTFGQRCPQVIVNNRADLSSYVVELDHEGGKGLLRHKDKIAVFVRTSGDSIFSESTLSVGGSVQDACGAITKHWIDHASELVAPAPKVATEAKETQVAATSSLSLVSRASFSISSNPPAGDIEIDGNFVGSTPSTIQLELGEHEIVIRKKGFQSWQRKVKVTGGSLSISADLDAVAAQAN